MPTSAKKSKRAGAAGRILEGMAEAAAYARGELELKTYVIEVPGPVDVKAIRTKLNLSQSQFAGQYGFNIRTLQEWESGKARPPCAVRAYLTVIDRAPAAVQKALRGESAA